MSFRRKKGWKYLIAWGAIGAVVLGALVIFDKAIGADLATSTGAVGLFGVFAFMVITSMTSGDTLAESVHGAAPADVDAVFSFSGPNGGTLALSCGVIVAGALIGGLAMAVAGAAVGSAVVVAGAIAFHLRVQGLFLALLLPAMLVACLGAAGLLSPLETWKYSGPFLLFLGLLTSINSPFDWASLGLTRALLRRGLELKGWWPYHSAFVDAALAAVIIAALALVMVISVQAFDELAVHSGGEKAMVLPLDTLFDGIAKNPAAYEYWWAYELLLSSMIPSFINLAIGGMALTRGIPWLAHLLLQWMPAGRAVPEYKRQLTAIGLTTQMFAGAFLGMAAQVFLVWGLIFHILPLIGLDLLDMARAVAAFDLPMHVRQLFAGRM